jgi:cob(I)alamin adenosyltransferase
MLIINTGDGKGKTTAAFGQALRMAGHGYRVCIIQFIKGKWQTGEAKAVANFRDLIELHVCGTGFTWEAEHIDEVKDAARSGWKLAGEKIASGMYRLVVLDELTYLLNYGIIEESEAVDLLRARPAGVNVVVTGRGAGTELIGAADIVTEMKEIKHAYREGIEAGKGVEF